jgi:hypothetical protein
VRESGSSFRLHRHSDRTELSRERSSGRGLTRNQGGRLLAKPLFCVIPHRLISRGSTAMAAAGQMRLLKVDWEPASRGDIPVGLPCDDVVSSKILRCSGHPEPHDHELALYFSIPIHRGGVAICMAFQLVQSIVHSFFVLLHQHRDMLTPSRFRRSLSRGLHDFC